MIELWGRGCYLAVAEYYMLLALWSWRQRLLLSIIIKREKDTSATFISALLEQHDNKESIQANSYKLFFFY